MTQYGGGPLSYESLPTEFPYRNWRLGLMAFGIIAICMGACSGCLGSLVPLALLVPRPAGQPVTQYGFIIGAALVYIAAAAALIWIGLGIVRMRRWSRPVVISTAIISLFGGIYFIIVFAVISPVTRQTIAAGQNGSPAPPAAMVRGIAFGTIAVFGFFMLLVPGSFLLFFKNPKAKATFEFYDPTPGWADRCPIPVMVVAIGLLLFGVLSPMGAMQHIAPVFGTVLRGIPAVAVQLAFGGIALILARMVFQLRSAGWLGTLAFCVLLAIAFGMTTIRSDLPDLYRAAGLTSEQLRAFQQVQRFGIAGRVAMALPPYLMAIIYLFWARKYFLGNAVENAHIAPPALPH